MTVYLGYGEKCEKSANFGLLLEVIKMMFCHFGTTEIYTNLQFFLVLTTNVKNKEKVLKIQILKSSKKKQIILFYAIVHKANGLELTGSFRHAAFLFVHT